MFDESDPDLIDRCIAQRLNAAILRYRNAPKGMKSKRWEYLHRAILKAMREELRDA